MGKNWVRSGLPLKPHWDLLSLERPLKVVPVRRQITQVSSSRKVRAPGGGHGQGSFHFARDVGSSRDCAWGLSKLLEAAEGRGV